MVRQGLSVVERLLALWLLSLVSYTSTPVPGFLGLVPTSEFITLALLSVMTVMTHACSLVGSILISRG